MVPFLAWARDFSLQNIKTEPGVYAVSYSLGAGCRMIGSVCCRDAGIIFLPSVLNSCSMC